MRRAGLSLRAATDADLPFLRDLYASTRADEGAAAGWPEAAWARFVDDQFALQHRHMLGLADTDFLLVTRRGRAVGRLYLDRSGPTWRIVDVALLPDHRRGGAGTALIRWVQRAAARGGATEVDLHVLHANPAAARLYVRLGFVDAFTAVPTHRRMVWAVGRRTPS